MAPKIKGVDAVKMKRTKITFVSAASRAGAASQQLSEHEHALERIAVMRAVTAMNRQKRLEQDKGNFELAKVLLADRKTLLKKQNLVLKWWIREMEDFTERRH